MADGSVSSAPERASEERTAAVTGDGLATSSPATEPAESPAASEAVFRVEPIPWEPSTVEWDRGAPAPGFYDWRTTFPFLRRLIEFKSVIESEVDALSTWHAWPEVNLYQPHRGHEWKVLPFVYTFPANDPSRSAWVDPACALCPKTAAILRALPGVRTALFSRLGPRTQLSYHQGWAELSNYVLRCHFALRVPEPKACGVVVEEKVTHHVEGDILVFDDSQRHYAFNRHPDKSRVVLIFDLPRPEGLPLGRATGGKTEELRSFIDYFN